MLSLAFPMIERLEAARKFPATSCGSVAYPIHLMEHEHDQAGAALREFPETTSFHRRPGWRSGCGQPDSLALAIELPPLPRGMFSLTPLDAGLRTAGFVVLATALQTAELSEERVVSGKCRRACFATSTLKSGAAI